MSRHERGFALLGFVIAIAVMASIASYAALFVAMNQARQGQFSRARQEARDLTEAGLVIAMQRLYADPAYCPGGDGVGGPERVDTNNNGIATDATDATVTVIVTNCGAGNTHTISSRLAYF